MAALATRKVCQKNDGAMLEVPLAADDAAAVIVAAVAIADCCCVGWLLLQLLAGCQLIAGP